MDAAFSRAHPGDYTKKISLRVEPYCVLCRKDLPASARVGAIGVPLRSQRTPDWELDVIAFFDTSKEQDNGRLSGEPMLRLFRDNLRENSWPPLGPYTGSGGRVLPRWVLRKASDQGKAERAKWEHEDEDAKIGVFFPKRMVEDKTRASPYRCLFFVHTCCWKTIKKMPKGHGQGKRARTGKRRHGHNRWTFERLLRLAEQTRAIVPRGCGDAEREYMAAISGFIPPGFPTHGHPTSRNEETQSSGSLDALISLAIKLPLELQAEIVGYLDDGLAASLFRARETAFTLESVLQPRRGKGKRFLHSNQIHRLKPLIDDPRASWPQSEPGGGLWLPQKGYLVARSVRVLGYTYLQNIEFFAARDYETKRITERLRKHNERRRRRLQKGSEHHGDTIQRAGNGSIWDQRIFVRGDCETYSMTLWIGPLGVQALSFQYADDYGEPDSEILGTPPAHPDPRCMIQNKIFHHQAYLLSAVRDEVKVLAIESDAHDAVTEPWKDWPKRTLWDPYSTKLHGDSLKIVDTEQFPGRLLHYPDRRLCHYLPLKLDGEDSDFVKTTKWATGLTMYCFPGGGITGATSHFGGDGITTTDTQKHIGCHCGTPVHMRLAPGEHIDFLGLRVLHDLWMNRGLTAPSLIARTNFGQAVLFGSLYAAFTETTSVPVTDLSSASTTRSKPIAGIFTDKLTVDGCQWKSIGTHVDVPSLNGEMDMYDKIFKRPAPSAQPETDTGSDNGPHPVTLKFAYPPLPPPPMDTFMSLAFFSRLCLSDIEGDGIRRLQVCWQDGNCIGLAVHHTVPYKNSRDRVTILGMWAPDGQSNLMGGPARVIDLDIPDNDPLPVLTFVFEPKGHFVRDILVCKVHANRVLGPQDVVIDTSKQKDVLWWYTEDNNVVKTWYQPDLGHDVDVVFPDPQGVPHGYAPKEVWGVDAALDADNNPE